jgi:hypothetical protein
MSDATQYIAELAQYPKGKIKYIKFNELVMEDDLVIDLKKYNKYIGKDKHLILEFSKIDTRGNLVNKCLALEEMLINQQTKGVAKNDDLEKLCPKCTDCNCPECTMCPNCICPEIPTSINIIQYISIAINIVLLLIIIVMIYKID